MVQGGNNRSKCYHCVCGVELGEHCLAAAGAVVNKDVKPFALMVGVPAKQIGWMSKYGEQITGYQ